MMMPLRTEFNTVITPPKLLVRLPLLMMPLPLPVFDTMIVPELVRVPLLVMPVPAVFDITSVVPDGTTSSSPAAIVLPLVLTVHVFVGIVHIPPYVGHEMAFSVVVTAYAFWPENTTKMDRAAKMKSKTGNLNLIPPNLFFVNNYLIIS